MSKFKILHNPRCSKSRQTLALLEEQNADVEIIEYLKTPPSSKELKFVLTLLKLSPQDIMRKKETEYKESGLDNLDLSEAAQLKLITEYPKVLERPIVYSEDKAVIGRPPENVLNLM